MGFAYKTVGRKRPNQFCITLSNASARLVNNRMEKLELKCSEFFQTLINQAEGARLACVTDFPNLPPGGVK